MSRTPHDTPVLNYPADLVGDFAHDVCGSTHAIMGYASLLSNRVDDPELHGMLDSLVLAARRLTVVAESMTASTRHPGEPEATARIDLEPVVDQARARWEDHLAARRIEVEVILGPVPLILAAATGLDALLDLLLASALRHSARGSSLSFSTDVGASEVRVYFDTSGHSPLDRFERHLAAHLGRQAGVNVAFDETANASRVVMKAAIAEPNAEMSGRILVLHIDDDGATRDLVSAVLTAEGMDLVSVGSIREAREALSSNLPDVVIVDQRVGDERGIDFIREIRPDHTSLSVVMLSADQDQSLGEAASELGVLRLQKPVTNEDLVASVHAALSVYL